MNTSHEELMNKPRTALATAREALRMTLRRAAEGFDKVSHQAISDWEQGKGGKSDPSHELLGEYCDWLRQQAVDRDIEPDQFERWVLCPIDFPRQTQVQRKRGAA